MGMRITKHAERGLALISGGLFDVIQFFNKYKPNPSFTPKWSDKPLLKSWQKTKPTLGWPRSTDSLCPNCVIEARSAILAGEKDVSVLLSEKVGEIKAQIVERDGGSHRGNPRLDALQAGIDLPNGLLRVALQFRQRGAREVEARRHCCAFSVGQPRWLGKAVQRQNERDRHEARSVRFEKLQCRVHNVKPPHRTIAESHAHL